MRGDRLDLGDHVNTLNCLYSTLVDVMVFPCLRYISIALHNHGLFNIHIHQKLHFCTVRTPHRPFISLIY